MQIDRMKRKIVHFIGIGGSSMSCIAEFFLKNGCTVTGSDILKSKNTKRLEKLGIKIYYKHEKYNVQKSDCIIFSNAISKKNPEFLFAKIKNIPIFSRSEILSKIIKSNCSILVSGTHGKTTTVSMIIKIYQFSGLQPTFFCVEKEKYSNKKINIGKKDYFISEIDESDNCLHLFSAKIIVVTNIENEHINSYGSLKKLELSFLNFLNKNSDYGYAIICIDNPILFRMKPMIKKKVITYGFVEKADFRIIKYQQKENFCNFFIVEKNKKFSKIHLSIPGKHNALNATASFIVAKINNISEKKIQKSIKKFVGVYRRFEILGIYDFKNYSSTIKKIMIIDDYGHHPNEIKYTIDTIKNGWPKRRIVMIFQPHRYTRMKNLYFQFLNTLLEVDYLIILNTFSAWEKKIENYSGYFFYKKIRKIKKEVIFVNKNRKIEKILRIILLDKDIILIQGAGDVSEIIKKIIKKKFFLKSSKNKSSKI
ncbi:UDP-N-acetylmuramate--L-alanine ligase [bacterium endosymbiont of Pedicinus badii]|uniref:UDP-N-acetylmuramate--L-alanine ligase n=1 Tax=bacterium endosymbiont of Pedicinus badii TaxID=1719126 RepID=UPI0009BA94AE|nr:UDP-N-acetylmuramate--L-alanine ligase [bacterium endosymbiont of Pedicinus badii]OQM34221.1 hypothetical protein AOQ89_02715 [bacterium endosymbiont of Pedicinus badii]